MVSNLKTKIANIFNKVQHNRSCHRKQLEKLKGYYAESNLDQFFNQFITFLKIPLSMSDNHIHIIYVLEFAAKFSLNLNNREEECPFLNKLYTFLIQHHQAKDLNVRYRICNFLSLLLNTMGEDAIIDDELYDHITTAMVERMQDKSPKVRVQAVKALQRLQDPNDENCPVIEVYLYHLSKDPNADVRKTILQVIGKNKKILAAALKRTCDVNMTVRKAAYMLISKITARSLTIEQREIILKNGLKDQSETVRQCVMNDLLPSWLRHYNNDYIGLMKGLDAENALNMAILSLNTLIKIDKSPLSELVKQTELDATSRLIPIDKTSSEKVLFWRCLAEHLHRESRTEELEEIIPELTPFCTYIRDYLVYMKMKQYEFWEVKCQEFVLYQLFEMTKLYDLSDESGKNCLKQLILDTLSTSHQSERIIMCIVEFLEKIIPDLEDRISQLIDVINELRMPMKPQTQQIIPSMTEKDRHKIKMQKARMRVQLSEYEEDEYNAIKLKNFLEAEELKLKIAEIKKQLNELNELNEPIAVMNNDEICEEKNDPETLTSCLRIMCFMMKSSAMKILSPILRTLMENLAIINIHHPDAVVRKLALVSLGLCCLMDKQLAKEHIFDTFLMKFSLEQECPEICGETLKVMLDLLCCYGLKHFDISDIEEELSTTEKSRRNRMVRLYTNHDNSLTGTEFETTDSCDGTKMLKFLIDLMSSENKDCRRIATEGLLKLLANKKISSAQLVSRFIIYLHTPERRSDTSILQQIVNFLNHFVREDPDSQDILEKVFFITLRILENSFESASYVDINQNKVAELILILTNSRFRKPGHENLHNNLVHKIFAEILSSESNIDIEVLVKSLVRLNLHIESEEMKNLLLDTSKAAIEKLKVNYPLLIKHIEQFKKKLLAPLEENTNKQEKQDEQHSIPELMDVSH